MCHLFKIKLLSEAAFLFLISILFKANKAMSAAPGNDINCSKPKRGGLQPDLQCCGMAKVVLLFEWPGEKHPELIWSGNSHNPTLSLGHLDPVNASINQRKLHLTEACPGWDWVRPNSWSKVKLNFKKLWCYYLLCVSTWCCNRTWSEWHAEAGMS